MLRVLVTAAVWAGFALPVSAQPPTADRAPRVGIYLDFDNVPGRVPVQVMKKEVDTLLKNSGVALDWRMAGEDGTQSLDGLVVLKFQGQCRVEPWDTQEMPIAPGKSGALGATRVVDGRVLPFSEVKCDAVRQALSYLRPEANQGEKQRALGLAMGRVVAHELYHILARTTAHTARGLARAVESLQDLVSTSEIPFQAEDAEAIKKGVRSQEVGARMPGSSDIIQ